MTCRKMKGIMDGMSERTKGLGLVVVAVLIFGTWGILAKMIPASPLLLVFTLQIVGAIAFFLAAPKGVFSRLSQKDHVLIIAATLCITVSDLAFVAAVKLLPTVANALLIRFTFPLIIVFLAPLLLREAFSKRAVWAVGFGLAGLATILADDLGSYNWYGVSLALVSAISFALFLIFLKKVLFSVPVRVWLSYRYGLAFVVLLPVILISESFSAWSPQFIGSLLGFGFLFAVVGTFLHMEGIKRITAQEASVLGYIEPLSATVYAIFLLSEIPTLFVLAGGLLIIVSGFVVVTRT